MKTYEVVLFFHGPGGVVEADPIEIQGDRYIAGSALDIFIDEANAYGAPDQRAIFTASPGSWKSIREKQEKSTDV